MESFPLFFRIRTIAFTCIMSISFLWLVLLCVEMSARWSGTDQISHSLMILFLLTNTVTLVMLPMLILVEFRVWLDAARLFLLLFLQIGSAAAASFWTPQIQCLGQTPDDIAVCQLINVYTLIACWIIPAMLVSYFTYFAIVVYLQSRIPVVVEPKIQKHRSGDTEMGSVESLSLWREKLKEIVGEPGSNRNTPSRSPVFPTIHARQSSLPQPAFQHQSTLPNLPRRQSTMPSLPHADQQPLHSLSSLPDRHRSLPAFKRGSRGAHLHPLLTLSVSAAPGSGSNPQTPSSHSYSIPPSANIRLHSLIFGSGAVDAQPLKGGSKHLSLMPLSPRETGSPLQSPTTHSTRARLSKPLPSHLL